VPEGDTIHRVADRLRPALTGQPVVRFEAPRLVAAAGRRPTPGTVVDGVDAVGKHLLIRFAGGSVLRTHLGMTGSWHLTHPGDRLPKPPHLLRALVEVPGWVAACFAAPTVVLEHERARSTGAAPAHLGPDLASADLTGADIDACLARMGALAATAPAEPIADVLLDQRVACAVGNVFKSEVLWACRVDPATPVGELDDATRRRLLETAAAQLGANVARPGRRATFGPGLAVYGRRGRPCPRCGTPIDQRRQGAWHRTTYWCRTCQVVRR
jgi:endonuclease-8